MFSVPKILVPLSLLLFLMHTLSVAALLAAAALEVLLVIEETGTVGIVRLLGVLVAVSVQVVRENSRTTEEHTYVGAGEGRGREGGRRGGGERINQTNTPKDDFLVQYYYSTLILHTIFTTGIT